MSAVFYISASRFLTNFQHTILQGVMSAAAQATLIAICSLFIGNWALRGAPAFKTPALALGLKYFVGTAVVLLAYRALGQAGASLGCGVAAVGVLTLVSLRAIKPHGLQLRQAATSAAGVVATALVVAFLQAALFGAPPAIAPKEIHEWGMLGSQHTLAYTRPAELIIERSSLPMLKQHYAQSIMLTLSSFGLSSDNLVRQLFFMIVIAKTFLLHFAYGFFAEYLQARWAGWLAAILLLLANSFFQVSYFNLIIADGGFPFVRTGNFDIVFGVGTFAAFVLLFRSSLKDRAAFRIRDFLIHLALISAWPLSAFQNFLFLFVHMVSNVRWFARPARLLAYAMIAGVCLLGGVFTPRPLVDDVQWEGKREVRPRALRFGADIGFAGAPYLIDDFAIDKTRKKRMRENIGYDKKKKRISSEKILELRILETAWLYMVPFVSCLLVFGRKELSIREKTAWTAACLVYGMRWELTRFLYVPLSFSVLILCAYAVDSLRAARRPLVAATAMAGVFAMLSWPNFALLLSRGGRLLN